MFSNSRPTGRLPLEINGVRRWLSLGAYPAVGRSKAGDELRVHEKAREAAKKGEGDHPVVAARLERKAKKARPTVSQAFDEWIADKRMGSARKGGQPVRERTVTVLTENFDADIRDRIGDAKVINLTREALQGCIDAPRKRSAPGAAAHVYRTLRGLITFAIKRGYVDGPDPMRGIENPKPYRPAPVNAASDAELAALLEAVDGSHLWESTKLAIEFAVLTGARPAEIRLATWDEFKLARSLWIIPADRVKSGREFQIHLSRQAVSLLERAKLIPGMGKPKARGDAKNYVFPGANGEALEKMAVARALSRMAERAKDDGAKKLRPHDLRRTFWTMLSCIGVAPHIAELCMNHQETETMRRVYDGHNYFGETADAWDKAGAHVQALRQGGAQVIQLERAAPPGRR